MKQNLKGLINRLYYNFNDIDRILNQKYTHKKSIMLHKFKKKFFKPRFRKRGVMEKLNIVIHHGRNIIKLHLRRFNFYKRQKKRGFWYYNQYLKYKYSWWNLVKKKVRKEYNLMLRRGRWASGYAPFRRFRSKWAGKKMRLPKGLILFDYVSRYKRRPRRVRWVNVSYIRKKFKINLFNLTNNMIEKKSYLNKWYFRSNKIITFGLRLFIVMQNVNFCKRLYNAKIYIKKGCVLVNKNIIRNINFILLPWDIISIEINIRYCLFYSLYRCVCKLKEKVFKFKLNNKLLIYLRIKYKLLKKFPYSRRAMKKEKKKI